MAGTRPRWTTLDERDLRRLTLRVPVEVHEALLTLARARGQSMNALAIEALHGFLLQNGEWKPVEDWLLRTGKRYRAALADIEDNVQPERPWWLG